MLKCKYNERFSDSLCIRWKIPSTLQIFRFFDGIERYCFEFCCMLFIYFLWFHSRSYRTYILLNWSLERFWIFFSLYFNWKCVLLLRTHRVTARFIDVIIIACDAAHQSAVGWRRRAQIRVRRITNIIFISGQQCWWFNGYIDHNAAHITKSPTDTRRTCTAPMRSVRQSIRSS